MSLRRSEDLGGIAAQRRSGWCRRMRFDMQTAFLEVFTFPPPAPGPEILAQGDGASAGGAADAGVEPVVQRVVGDLPAGDVVPDVAPAPVGQRVVLEQALALEFSAVDQRHIGARARLLAAQAGHPGLLAGQRAGQRRHLADAAAGLAQFDAAVHGVGALALHELHHLFIRWLVHGERRVRARGLLRLQLLEQRQRFGVQRTGVEHEDFDRQRVGVDQVRDDHVLGAQAAGLGNGAGGRGLEQRDHGFAQLGVEVGRRLRVQRDGRSRGGAGQGREGVHAASGAASRANSGRGCNASPW